MSGITLTSQRIVLFICLSGISSGVLWANEDRIVMIRSEIEVMEQRLKDVEAGRKGVIDQLQTLNRKIDLRHRLINELKINVRQSSKRVRILDQKIQDMDSQITELSVNLSQREDELSILRQEVGERISRLYRHMAKNRAGLLLGARDLNDLFQRRKYLKAVERYDRSQLELIIEKRDKIGYERNIRAGFQQKLTIEQATKLSELERSRNLLSQRLSEERLLANEKNDKTKLLTRITGDSELVRAMLDERRQAIQEIENQISLLNLAPSIFSTKFEPTVPFNEQKGRLLPPLSRTVVSIPFGKNRHPKLGTVTINPGVDLKAVPGEAVFASAYGQVTRITYLRGFGNTVILDHSDGFYTVYSRLGSIIVQEGQVMEQGQTMGVVGNTGVEGDFHFEIWSSRKKQSPLKWLKRN